MGGGGGGGSEPRTGIIYVGYMYSGSARVLPKRESKKKTYMHLAQRDC